MEVISDFLITTDAHGAHCALWIILYSGKKIDLNIITIQCRIGIGIHGGLLTNLKCFAQQGLDITFEDTEFTDILGIFNVFFLPDLGI